MDKDCLQAMADLTEDYTVVREVYSVMFIGLEEDVIKEILFDSKIDAYETAIQAMLEPSIYYDVNVEPRHVHLPSGTKP